MYHVKCIKENSNWPPPKQLVHTMNTKSPGLTDFDTVLQWQSWDQCIMCKMCRGRWGGAWHQSDKSSWVHVTQGWTLQPTYYSSCNYYLKHPWQWQNCEYRFHSNIIARLGACNCSKFFPISSPVQYTGGHMVCTYLDPLLLEQQGKRNARMGQHWTQSCNQGKQCC